MATTTIPVQYTEATTAVTAANADLDSLANDEFVVSTTAYSNDASTERNTLMNVRVTIGTQGSARDASAADITLLIIPDDGAGNYPSFDTTDIEMCARYYAKDEFGNDVAWSLDAATTARDLTATNVRVPNTNFKMGLLNETGQALAASSGNFIYISGRFTYANIQTS